MQGSKQASKTLFNVGYNAIQLLARRLFSDMKMKYLQMRNIYEHKNLQGFQATPVAERTGTLQGPFIEECSNLLGLNLLSTLFHRLEP